MICVTPQQMAEIDRLTIEEHGLDALVLMENAARSVIPFIKPGRVLVLAGPGNNGGDAFVIARTLASCSQPVKVLCTEEPKSSECKRQLKLALEWGVTVQNLDSPHQTKSLLDWSDSVVDGIFGTGLTRNLGAPYSSLVNAVNSSNKPVLALDLPSGIHGASGQILGTAIQAAQTVTFGLLKRGHLLYPGKESCGEVVLTQPGFHPKALGKFERVRAFDSLEASKHLPQLEPTIHKGRRGKVLLLTGSKQYPGAGLLSVLGALRGGAGLVYHASPTHPQNLLPGAPESIPLSLDQAKDLKAFHSLVIGSGLGQKEGLALAKDWLTQPPLPVVVDADSLSQVPKLPTDARRKLVLTPHPGELSKLLGRSVAELESNRVESAIRAASELSCVVCFKGAPTVTACPAGIAYINTSGNPVLAQGGSGDVLSGLIGAFLAQRVPLLEAAALGSYIHGLAADIAAAENGPVGVGGSRIANFIPRALKKSYTGL